MLERPSSTVRRMIGLDRLKQDANRPYVWSTSTELTDSRVRGR